MQVIKSYLGNHHLLSHKGFLSPRILGRQRAINRRPLGSRFHQSLGIVFKLRASKFYNLIKENRWLNEVETYSPDGSEEVPAIAPEIEATNISERLSFPLFSRAIARMLRLKKIRSSTSKNEPSCLKQFKF
jgi:hypothetical protein